MSLHDQRPVVALAPDDYAAPIDNTGMVLGPPVHGSNKDLSVAVDPGGATHDLFREDVVDIPCKYHDRRDGYIAAVSSRVVESVREAKFVYYRRDPSGHTMGRVGYKHVRNGEVVEAHVFPRTTKKGKKN